MTYPGDLPMALFILRTVRGFNQKELAAASGSAASSICEYERGRKVPELRTLLALLGGMGYTLADLEAVRAFIRMLRREPPVEPTERRLRGEVMSGALRLAHGLLALAGSTEREP